ncbi:MAG: S9 family peptidase [Clostridia bacterium]|nr:S9 family peptidase [Clostridia bacterium]
MKRLCEEDLRRVVWLSCPALSPDGKTALYIRAESEYQTGKNRPVLMGRPLSGGEAKPVSSLTQMQALPRFSRDGRRIAFLSLDGFFPQVWVLDRQTGEERQITHFRRGVTDYIWHPDGESVVAVARYEAGVADPTREMTGEEYAAFCRQRDHGPRFTEKLMYKLDEAFGFLEDGALRLYRVPLDGGAPVALTDGTFDCYGPSFGKDALYFFARPDGRERALRPALYRLRDGRVEAVKTDRPVSDAVPVIERGEDFLYAGQEEERGRVGLFRRRGTEEASLLPLDTEGVDPPILGDDRSGDGCCTVQMDGDTIYMLTARRGRTLIQTPENGQTVIEGGCIQGFCAPRQGKLLFLKSQPDHPGELWCKDLRTGETAQLTHENDWIEAYDTGRPNPVPGRTPGWALLPAGEGPCPAVLYVHGGPECFYGEDIFFFEAQTLRAAGFAVLWCNPRGSAGYGKDYQAGAYGDEAVKDLVDFVDACAAMCPRIDLRRLGVTGGSYGGYMTNKLTLVTDRFRAAAAQRTWIDPATSYGTGDMGFLSGSGQTDFAAYMLNRAKGSILRDIGKLNAPTLILHGERDVRCGVEQADHLFNAIRALRPQVPCRLVIFPGENHNITRGGLMHNRIRHMLEIRRWMETYVKEEKA